jgi:sulfoxide reductase heme-binding subunit YedZ
VSNASLWYTARATGIVSLVLLTLVVALGIASRSGRQLGGLPRFAVAAVHRNASLLAVTMLVVHVTTLLLDKKANVHIADLVFPFMSTYRPFWTGLGTFALELLFALIVTSLLRNRLPERVWRSIHWLAYACWPIAFAHGLGSGTDSGAGWMRAIAGGCAAAVAAAIAWRLAPHFTEHSDVRRPLTRRPPAALGRTR